MKIITPDWPAPTNIQAFTTTREGGVSLPPYHSLNLSTSVGDTPHHVLTNQQRCISQHQLPTPILWLKQCHSTTVVNETQWTPTIEADASTTQQRHCVLAVLTADCLPLLICNQQGTEIAAIHAGWKGLANGIISQTLQTLQTPVSELLVWLGPAIGPHAFEINETIQQQFLHRLPAFEAGFTYNGPSLMANLYTLASIELHHAGVSSIYGGDFCTYSDSRFFSYRRDKEITGRIASMILMH